MLCVYTEYEKDEFRPYTYLVGEEVTAFADKLPDGCVALTIPKATYAKLTTESGQMPHVVISSWQEIWKMTANELGGKRAYKADFEVYDERAHNPECATLDIFISIM